MTVGAGPDLLLARPADVLAGLGHTPKTLPSVWLYDRRGSELFEEITGLDEYYQTRTETALLSVLRKRSHGMAASGRRRARSQ